MKKLSEKRIKNTHNKSEKKNKKKVWNFSPF